MKREKVEKGTSVEELKNRIEQNRINVSSENPLVEQTKILMDAVKLLAEDENEIFSQLEKSKFFGTDESKDFTLAWIYAQNPLEQVQKNLNDHGIKIDFKIGLLEDVLVEWLRRRHNVNRKRVQEYIDALEAASMKSRIGMIGMADESGRPGIRSRMI